MVQMVTDETNTHADPLLSSRWAQNWVHMWAQVLVIFLVYVTKGNISSVPRDCRYLHCPTQDNCGGGSGGHKHRITYVSGLFQVGYSKEASAERHYALTKEAYAIYFWSRNYCYL